MSATTYTLGVSWEMWSINQACAALYPSEFELLQLQKGVAEMVAVAGTMPSGWIGECFWLRRLWQGLCEFGDMAKRQTPRVVQW